MAFSATTTATMQDTVGGQKFLTGSYTNTGGSTGGDVITSMTVVNRFWLQPGGASAFALAPVVNETFPLQNSGGAVTIVTNANETGYWFAFGS